MRGQIDDKLVVALLKADAGRGLHLAEIGDRLGVPVAGRRALHRVLDDLVRRSEVESLPGTRYRSGRTQAAAEMSGEFRANPRGFGFLHPDDGSDDLYVAETAVGGAMHLDRVVAAILPRQADRGRRGGSMLREARILRIVDRTLRRLAGTLRRGPQASWLVPDDERVRGPVQLDTDAPGAPEGHAAVAEITRWPEQPGETPVGKIVRVLGEPGRADVELEKILLSHAIATEFGEDVRAEAAAVPQAVRPEDVLGRRDLRDLALATIDPVDARDHDDAIFVERTNDGFRAVVAIADVAHYVREKSALDREAADRSCSVYLPDRVVPMLPHALSSNLCSLLPDVDRLCMAADIAVSADGDVIEARFDDAIMRSRAKLNYAGAARTLGLTGEGEPDAKTETLKKELGAIHELAKVLRKKRMARGSLDFYLPEARVRIDPASGQVVDVYRSPSDPGEKAAYGIVEELMLLCNETVAEEFRRRDVAVVYRVHDRPDEQKLAAFSALARPFGFALSVDEGLSPIHLAQFLKRVEGKPVERPLNQLLLRAMKQAVYDPVNIGHFGLAARAYLHFTSPIRRYPDLLVHRALKALLADERIDPARYAELAALASRRERRAMEVERDAVGLYRALLMQGHVGDEYDGAISGVAPQGLFVELDAPFVEGLVRIEELGEDFFEFREDELRIVGRESGRAFGLGDRLRVRVDNVSLTRRQIQLAIVEQRAPMRRRGFAGKRRGRRR